MARSRLPLTKPPGRSRRTLRGALVAFGAVMFLGDVTPVMADTVAESGTSSDVTPQRDLTSGETSDLLHQLQLVNGVSAPAGGGWTFIPMISLAEEVTNNVYQVHSPLRSDLITFISPGFQAAANLPRLQLTVSYAPTLSLYTETGPLNSLTQQLNGYAEITAVPELLFIDLRALSGVSNLYGGYGGIGNVGATSVTAGNLAGLTNPINSQGLNRQNELQTSSFIFNPYVLRKVDDYGTLRLSYTAGLNHSDGLAGFAAPPFPTGGQNNQTSLYNDGSISFTSGEIGEKFRNSISLDASQTQMSTSSGYVNGFTGEAAPTSTFSSSSRIILNDQITYQMNREVAWTVSAGHENIKYSGNSGGENVDGLTWQVGTILTPNPDSQLSLSYGLQNGYKSFTVAGYYQATARTALTVNYLSSLGTQLDYLQNQLNGTQPNATGQLTNIGTNGQPVFLANSLARQNGVFRTDSLTLGETTSLDRDVLSLNLVLSSQSTVGVGNPGIPTKGVTAYANWIHAMRPDMNVSAMLSFNQQERANGGPAALGNYDSYALRLAWSYQISDTFSMNVSYSSYERISDASTNNINQSLAMVSFTKKF